MRRLILLSLATLPAAAAAQGRRPRSPRRRCSSARVEKGDLISAADFETAQRPASVARSALGPAEAKGMEAGRRLMAGSPVRATDVVRQQMVKRGETVVVTVRAGTLSITTTGKRPVRRRRRGCGARPDPQHEPHAGCRGGSHRPRARQHALGVRPR